MGLLRSLGWIGTARVAALAGLALLAAPIPGEAQRSGASSTWTLPLFTPAGDVQEGFARIINHSNRGGTVRIHGTDDTGRSRGPITLSIGARATRHFNSGDLEGGNSAKGLPVGLGNGTGRWRLRLESDLDIEAAAYIRTEDGFLASVHDVVPTSVVGGETVHRVPIFNPASNRNQVSSLRLVNLTGRRANVTIEGRDDSGRTGLDGEVRLSLPANGARHVSVQQLESGAAGLSGRLGDGTGKWQLFVTADEDIEVLSLFQTPTGHLTNLSVPGRGRSPSIPTLHFLPLFRPAGQSQQGFARIINRSGRSGTVLIHGTDDTGRRRGPVLLSIAAEATRHFNSDDLEGGNAAKGLTGELGNGTGDWRLELDTDLDIEASAYIRTEDGFLTAMHAVASTAEVGGSTVHQVPTFNPGSNHKQVSWLRLANLDNASVNVTIEARDDAGAPAPFGEVRLTLPPKGARRFSAQQLESGTPTSLRGRLGDGIGKWQLSVTAEGAIEVVSLLQSPTGHLSNLSTTPPRAPAGEAPGFEIVADGPATVRPLETIELQLPEGFVESDYLVLMDLSGSGAFGRIDTIEIEGVTTDDDRILFASPLTQVLAESNTSHSFAIRVRRKSDGQVSNVLDFSIDDINLPARLAGYPTIALEVVLYSLFTASADPLLGLAAPSIQPGLTVESARKLDLDTTLSDAQAEAILQSLFGTAVTDWAAGTRSRTAADLPGAPLSAPGTADAPSTDADTRIEARRCTAQRVCDALSDMLDCVDGLMKKFTPRGGRLDASMCSVTRFRDELVEGWQDYTEKLSTWLPFGRLATGRLGRALISKKAIQQISTSNAMLKPVVEANKAYRTLDRLNSGVRDGLRHLARDRSGTFLPTLRGLKSNYENGRAISQQVTEGSPELIREADLDFGRRNLADHEREAYSDIVNESDRLRQEASNLDDLEDVYLGEEDPRDGIGNDPSRRVVVAENCEFGYEEFPIDDETSACVFESLVEPNCYPGSRRVRIPDLGRERDNVCLYYSLDFFQPSGTCRPNYDRVFFEGRWTCRWDELEPHEPAWYTLHKEEDDGPQEWTHVGLTCVDVRLDRFESTCRSLGFTRKSEQAAILTNNCGRDVRVLVAWQVPPEHRDPLFGEWTNYVNTLRPGQVDPVASGFCLEPERTLPLRTCAHYDRPGVFIDPSCPTN